MIVAKSTNYIIFVQLLIYSVFIFLIVHLSFPATPVGVSWNPRATYCEGYKAKLENAYKHA